MIKNKKIEAGFTLIELLVVIAIIGILSSVVLASLNIARSRGADAKVKSQIANIRSAAEVYSDANSGYNGSAGDIDGTTLTCATANSMFQDINSGMIQYTDLNNYPAATTIRCSSTSNSFVVSASLNTAGEFWCVDSSGESKLITGVDHLTAHPDGATSCS